MNNFVTQESYIEVVFFKSNTRPTLKERKTSIQQLLSMYVRFRLCAHLEIVDTNVLPSEYQPNIL